MVNFKYYNTGAPFNSTSLQSDDIAFVEDSNSLFTHGKEYKFITDAILNAKQDVLTAGAGIKIQDGVITNTVIPTTEGKEIVQVVVSSDSANVSGLGLNVYYNGESDPSATYTTDEHGMCAFDVPYGYVYDLTFPTINGYKDIPTEHHTATIIQRSIEVEYVAVTADAEDGEELKVHVLSKSGNELSVYPNVSISVMVDGTTTSYTTDSNGNTSILIPYGKIYTVTAPKIENKYIGLNGYAKQFTANSSKRSIVYTYKSYQSGLYIVDTEGNDYTLEEWEDAVEAGTKTNTEAKLIKVATNALIQNNGVFGIDIDMWRERTYGANKTWADLNVQFNSIPIDGNSSSSLYYYDGLTSSRLILEEGDNRTIGTGAVDKCLALSIKLNEGEEDELTLPGFLGSTGQWNALWTNVVEIDDILLSVRPNGTYLASTLTSNKWTSTLYSAYIAYHWTTSAGSNGKVGSSIVVPFFAF